MSAESIMFEKLAEAINTADISQIKALFNQARTGLNSDALLSQVDGNGDTLLHLLLKSGQRDVVNAGILSYEAGFWLCVDMTNASGEKPLDIVDKLPLANEDFKQRTKNYFSPSFKQSWVLKQFTQYLKLQHEKNPESYKLEDVNAILQTLKQGHCSGFAALWAQGCLEEGEPDQMYVDSLKSVVYWDAKKETLTPQLEKEFERAISLARFGQFSRDNLRPERLQWDKDKNPNELSPELLISHQLAWDVIWEKDKFQTENVSEIKQIRQDIFKEYIAEFAVPKNEGKVAYVLGNNHVISFFYKDNTFHIFDSNYRGGVEKENLLKGISSHFKINDVSDYELVAREIQSRVYEVFGKDKQYLDFNMSFSDKKGKPLGVYPDVDLLMARSIHKDIMFNSDKIFSPSDFINHIKLLESKLPPAQIKEIYQNVRLDPLKINEVYSKGWDDFSPLVEAIKIGNTALVKCLLQCGADINVAVESKLPLVWAQESGNAKLIKIIENDAKKKADIFLNEKPLLFNNDLMHPKHAVKVVEEIEKKESHKKRMQGGG